MITYTWNIVQLNCYPEADGETDVVFNAHWTLTGVDGEYTGYVYGSIGVTLDPTYSFTPYADLTKDQVVGWVQSALGEETVTAYEKTVADQIANAKNPPVVNPPLPWIELTVEEVQNA